MVYLLNNSNLPWSEFHKIFKNGNYEFNDYLRKRLDIKYTKDFFKLSPKSLRDIIKRVLTLQFDEEPPYDTICDKLRQEIAKEIPIDQTNQTNIHQFEWIHNHASRIKDKIMKENIHNIDYGEAKRAASNNISI